MIDKFPKQVRIADDVICKNIQDEVVLLNLASQEFYGLGSSGARIWELLVENGNLTTVAGKLCELYAGDHATIQRDFYELVGELIESGLLKAADV